MSYLYRRSYNLHRSLVLYFIALLRKMLVSLPCLCNRGGSLKLAAKEENTGTVLRNSLLSTQLVSIAKDLLWDSNKVAPTEYSAAALSDDIQIAD